MSTAAPRLSPPFRADHIGSLKRPVALLQKRKESEEAKCTQEELRLVEDEAIRNIVQMQRDVGIKAITDGEFRRCVMCSAVDRINYPRSSVVQHLPGQS